MAEANERPGRGTRSKGGREGAVTGPPEGERVPGLVLGGRSWWVDAARVELAGEEPAEHRFRRLLGAYLAGAHELVVRERTTVGEETRRVVEEFLQRTEGMEVAFVGPNEIRLWESSVPPGPVTARRVEALGRAVVRAHREAVASWGVLPLVGEDAWDRKDDAIDRGVWLVQRRLVQGSWEDAARAVPAWTVVRSLERIADHATNLGRLGSRLFELAGAGHLLRSLRQYHAQAMVHLEGSLTADDDATANRCLDVGEALLSSGLSLVDHLLPAFEEYSVPASGAAAVTLALESVRRTIAYAQDIAEVPLQQEYLCPTPALARGGSPAFARRPRRGAATVVALPPHPSRALLRPMA